MKRRRMPKPTEAELSILRVLWDRGQATVREVHDALQGDRAVGYTTVLKLLQIMAEKDLVVRDERQRSHVYRSAIGESATQTQLIGDLLDRAFAGSAKKLVMHALAAKPASAAELREIRKIIDEMERQQ
jgi:BlaI family penicillinase repressor